MLVNSQRGEPSRQSAGAATLPLKRTILTLVVASVLLNLLALNGPLFMLQVYDRVLASHSVPTLISLAILCAGLFGFQGVLDSLRSRLLLRLGEGFDARFSRMGLRAITRAPLMARAPGDGMQPIRDIDQIRNFLSSPGPGVFFDLPWVPFYLGICFLFHYWLGITATAGALVLIAITLVADLSARRPAKVAMEKAMLRGGISEDARHNAETIRAMGMEENVFDRWHLANDAYIAAGRRTGDMSSAMSGLSRAVRQGLQSAILAVGAYLVIERQASAGVMIAASIMMGRAMSPVDTAVGQWKNFVAARQGWERLKKLIPLFDATPQVLGLPAPVAQLRAEHVTIAPPGSRAPSVMDVSFTLAAGSALGVIGPSGSGKSTLVRGLMGVWGLARGCVRLDGATLDQWTPEALGRHIGYMPQSVELFEGSIAENIARFDETADDAAIIAAARQASVHEFVTSLPHGYQTRLGTNGAGLSGGQKQRICLARALFGNPFLLVLDEPSANLDADGEAAVIQAIKAVRARNGIAIVIAHRPSAIHAVDQVLVMEAGRIKMLGSRDAVLSKIPRQPVPTQTPVNTANPFRVVAQAGMVVSQPMEADADATR